MTEIPDRPFNKIAIDLVTECETSTSGKQAYPYHYQPLNRMARGIPYTGKICRHYSFNLHQ